jgi:hypothetical protein
MEEKQKPEEEKEKLRKEVEEQGWRRRKGEGEEKWEQGHETMRTRKRRKIEGHRKAFVYAVSVPGGRGWKGLYLSTVTPL